MPGFSVSCSLEQANKVQEMAISPSKAFQLGIEIAAKGGVDALEKIVRGNRELARRITTLTEALEAEKKRNERLKTLLNKERDENLRAEQNIADLEKKLKIKGGDKRD